MLCISFFLLQCCHDSGFYSTGNLAFVKLSHGAFMSLPAFNLIKILMLLGNILLKDFCLKIS